MKDKSIKELIQELETATSKGDVKEILKLRAEIKSLDARIKENTEKHRQVGDFRKALRNIKIIT